MCATDSDDGYGDDGNNGDDGFGSDRIMNDGSLIMMVVGSWMMLIKTMMIVVELAAVVGSWMMMLVTVVGSRMIMK